MSRSTISRLTRGASSGVTLGLRARMSLTSWTVISSEFTLAATCVAAFLSSSFPHPASAAMQAANRQRSGFLISPIAPIGAIECKPALPSGQRFEYTFERFTDTLGSGGHLSSAAPRKLHARIRMHASYKQNPAGKAGSVWQLPSDYAAAFSDFLR